MPKPGALPDLKDIVDGTDDGQVEGAGAGQADGGAGAGEGTPPAGSPPPAAASGQPGEGEAAGETPPPAGSGQPPLTPQSVPYSRFAEVNRQLQEMKKQVAQAKTKEQRQQALEEQDKFLEQYFEQHPEEYKRMVSIHEGKKDQLENAQEAAQQQLDSTGQINPALARQIQALGAEVRRMDQALKQRDTQQVENQKAQEHYDQFRLELNEFEADKKYEGFKGDKELLSLAIGLTKSNGKSLKENLVKLADRQLVSSENALKKIAATTVRRVGARVETGGGGTGSTPKPQPKFGTEEHTKMVAESY